MFKFIIVLVVSMLLCDASVLKDACSTPGAKEGLCVRLQDCPSISAMSNDFDTPMNYEKLNYLTGSYCGYFENSARVCCPLEEVTMLKIDETTTSIQSATTSASQERDDAPALIQSTMSSSQNRDETTTLIQSTTTSTQNRDETTILEQTTGNPSQNRDETPAIIQSTTNASQNSDEITLVQSTTNVSQNRDETTTSGQTSEETTSSNEII